MITEDGCWADYRTVRPAYEGRPCLFLDRDGVAIEDTGYPHDPAAIRFIPETLELVRDANQQGFAVGLVSNQSGIGRGYFGWDAFAAVQDAVDAALATHGGRLDFVLACPHVAEAKLPLYRQADHPWRKPAPGMLVEAGRRLGLAMARSAMVGDRASDMKAAFAAGLPHRALLADAEPPDHDGAWTVVDRPALENWFRRTVVAGLARPL